MEYSSSSDFIELKYKPNSEGPSRLFRSFESVLTSFELQNREIIKAIDPLLEIHFYIERIEESSIVVWLLKRIMTPDYDELLIKPEFQGDITRYLEDSQAAFVDTIKSSPGKRIGNKSLEQFEDKVIESANETGVVQSLNYCPPNRLKIAESFDIFSKSTQLLLPEEQYVFKTNHGNVELGRFKSEIDLKQLRIEMTKKEVKTKGRRIMMIKMADFLGKSKWTFKYLEKPLEAKISDDVWLDKFHNKEDIVTPGDSLEAEVEEIRYFDKNNKLIDTEVTILEVYDVHEGTVEYSTKGKKKSL